MSADIEAIRQQYRQEALKAVKAAEVRGYEAGKHDTAKEKDDEIKRWKYVAESLTLFGKSSHKHSAPSDGSNALLKNSAPLVKYVMEQVYRDVKKEFASDEDLHVVERMKKVLLASTQTLTEKLPALVLAKPEDVETLKTRDEAVKELLDAERQRVIKEMSTSNSNVQREHAQIPSDTRLASISQNNSSSHLSAEQTISTHATSPANPYGSNMVLLRPQTLLNKYQPFPCIAQVKVAIPRSSESIIRGYFHDTTVVYYMIVTKITYLDGSTLDITAEHRYSSFQALYNSLVKASAHTALAIPSLHVTSSSTSTDMTTNSGANGHELFDANDNNGNGGNGADGASDTTNSAKIHQRQIFLTMWLQCLLSNGKLQRSKILCDFIKWKHNLIESSTSSGDVVAYNKYINTLSASTDFHHHNHRNQGKRNIVAMQSQKALIEQDLNIVKRQLKALYPRYQDLTQHTVSYLKSTDSILSTTALLRYEFELMKTPEFTPFVSTTVVNSMVSSLNALHAVDAACQSSTQRLILDTHRFIGENCIENEKQLLQKIQSQKPEIGSAPGQGGSSNGNNNDNNNDNSNDNESSTSMRPSAFLDNLGFHGSSSGIGIAGSDTASTITAANLMNLSYLEQSSTGCGFRQLFLQDSILEYAVNMRNQHRAAVESLTQALNELMADTSLPNMPTTGIFQSSRNENVYSRSSAGVGGGGDQSNQYDQETSHHQQPPKRKSATTTSNIASNQPLSQPPSTSYSVLPNVDRDRPRLRPGSRRGPTSIFGLVGEMLGFVSADDITGDSATSVRDRHVITTTTNTVSNDNNKNNSGASNSHLPGNIGNNMSNTANSSHSHVNSTNQTYQQPPPPPNDDDVSDDEFDESDEDTPMNRAYAKQMESRAATNNSGGNNSGNNSGNNNVYDRNQRIRNRNKTVAGSSNMGTARRMKVKSQQQNMGNANWQDSMDSSQMMQGLHDAVSHSTESYEAYGTNAGSSGGSNYGGGVYAEPAQESEPAAPADITPQGRLRKTNVSTHGGITSPTPVPSTSQKYGQWSSNTTNASNTSTHNSSSNTSHTSNTSYDWNANTSTNTSTSANTVNSSNNNYASTAVPSTTSTTATSSTAPAESQGPLPEGWEQVYTDDGRVYYYHTISRVSRWDRPSEAMAAKIDERLQQNQKKMDDALKKRKQELDASREIAEQKAKAQEDMNSIVSSVINSWKYKNPPKSIRDMKPTMLGKEDESLGFRDLVELILDLPTVSSLVTDEMISDTLKQEKKASSPSEVKKQYMKIIRVIHPDKLPANISMEQRIMSDAIFVTLSEAYEKWRSANGM